MAITDFQGKYHFLSNFQKSEVEYEGVKYPTVEHAFQAAKTSNEDEKKMILATKTPLMAKRKGLKVTLRSDWEEVKYDIMTEILRKKFENMELRQLLLDTKQNELVEGNNWHDNHWGKCLCEHCEGTKAENHLGKILQKVRSELLPKK